MRPDLNNLAFGLKVNFLGKSEKARTPIDSTNVRFDKLNVNLQTLKPFWNVSPKYC